MWGHLSGREIVVFRSRRIAPTTTLTSDRKALESAAAEVQWPTRTMGNSPSETCVKRAGRELTDLRNAFRKDWILGPVSSSFWIGPRDGGANSRGECLPENCLPEKLAPM